MSNETVGKINTTALVDFLGDALEVRKSSRAGRYPLYLVTKVGPIHMNTRQAQEFILDNAQMKNSNEENVHVNDNYEPEETDTNNREPSDNKPGSPPEEKPEEEPGEPGKKTSFLDMEIF